MLGYLTLDLESLFNGQIGVNIVFLNDLPLQYIYMVTPYPHSNSQEKSPTARLVNKLQNLPNFQITQFHEIGTGILLLGRNKGSENKN